MISHHVFPSPAAGGVTSIAAAVPEPVMNAAASVTRSLKMRSALILDDVALGPKFAPTSVLTFIGIWRNPPGVWICIISFVICRPGRKPGWLMAGFCAVKFAVMNTWALMIG